LKIADVMAGYRLNDNGYFMVRGVKKYTKITPSQIKEKIMHLGVIKRRKITPFKDGEANEMQKL